jgi:hypothetical protein
VIRKAFEFEHYPAQDLRARRSGDATESFDRFTIGRRMTDRGVTG